MNSQMQWADQLTQELLIREPATRVQFRCWIPECLVGHHSCTQVTQIHELFHHVRDPRLANLTRRHRQHLHQDQF